MSEIEPTGQAGGPGLLAAFELVLRADKGDRAVAIGFMEKHSLLEAIDLATAYLRRKGRDGDAQHLFNSTLAFQTWPEDRLDELKGVGLDVLGEGLNPRFTHRIGNWRIAHLGRGEILVQAPKEHLCQGEDAPSADADG